MIIWLAALLFVIAGIILIVMRKDLAHLQALLAGGTMPPGCVIAEAIAFFVLAALVVVAHHYGLFGKL